MTQGDDRGARLQRLLAYLAADPKNGHLLADASDAALLSGQFDQAKSLLARAREIEPQNEALRFKFGHILLASQEYEAAKSFFLSLIDPQEAPPPGLLYNLAYAQFGCNQMEESLATLTRIAISDQVELPHYDLLLAKALYFSGQVTQALEPLQAYLKGHRSDLRDPGVCALILFDNDSNDTELAQSLAKQAISIDLTDVFAHLVMGSIELGRQQPAAARVHLSSVVEAQPAWGRAWSALGYMELLNVELSKARINFQRAVRLLPEYLGAWQGLAWTEILLKDFAAAREAIQRAMSLDRTYSENHGTLAVIEILDGRSDLAEVEIKRGLRLDPGSPSSQYARRLILIQKGDKEAGDKLMQRILKNSGLDDGTLIAAMQARAMKVNRPGALLLSPSGNPRKH